MNDPAPPPPEGYEIIDAKTLRVLYDAEKVQAGLIQVWIGALPGWERNFWHPRDDWFYAAPKGVSVDLTLPPQESVLQEAERLVNGDRQQSYGDASESFERIADFWHAYLKTKLKSDVHLSAKDVASMMILMKVSRSVTSNKRDNWVDMAGYAELGSKLDD